MGLIGREKRTLRVSSEDSLTSDHVRDIFQRGRVKFRWVGCMYMIGMSAIISILNGYLNIEIQWRLKERNKKAPPTLQPSTP